ncbi:MAG: ComEC/Rec2 family competence protein [Candidatus Kerfeldbacteria bacterium]
MSNISKSKIFLVVCIFFVIGVGLRSFVVIPLIIIYCIGGVGLSILIIFGKNKIILVLGLGIIFFVLGVFRYDISVSNNIGVTDIQHYHDQEIELIGIVSKEKDQRSDHAKLTIKFKGEINGKVLIKTELYPVYDYGDVLKIKCQMQAPEPIEFSTEAGTRIFNYDKYLSSFDIYTVCYRPQISLIAKDQGNILMSGLLKIKNVFTNAVQGLIAEPQASFLGALLLGAKKAIPDDLMNSFNLTGTTHIVALSGYNITIIAILILNICKILWIPRKVSFWVSLGVILFFVLITGAQASVVRAAIMGMLVLLATQLGRQSRVTNLLILAAVVMVIINPKVLIFDAGFQLSFLATMGLIYLSPYLEKGFKWLPDFFELRSSLVATLSATIMTLPLILFQFGRLSLIAPLANMLILPAIPLAMALGFIAAILSFIWQPLGMIVGWIVWLVLIYIIKLVEFFAQFEWSSYAFGNLSFWWLIIGYSILAIIFLFLNRKNNKTK